MVLMALIITIKGEDLIALAWKLSQQITQIAVLRRRRWLGYTPRYYWSTPSVLLAPELG